LEAGLLHALPTRWQLLLGGVEMAPYVLSPDVTAEARYRPGLWSHPVVRQLLIFREVGFDHFSAGSGLGCQLGSLCKQLRLTWRGGMPRCDLRLSRAWPGGLTRLRQSTLDLIEGRTPQARRQHRLARRLFPEPVAYYRR